MTLDGGWDFLTHHLVQLALVTLVAGVVSAFVVVVVLVRMPADYFVGERNHAFLDGYPLWVRVLATLSKSILAWVLIVLGLVMAFPGVPGQGLLTILVGVLLADFPGKRKLERRVVAIHAVHSVVNKVRSRFGRDPLQGVG